jgi:hypothetical protein
VDLGKVDALADGVDVPLDLSPDLVAGALETLSPIAGRGPHLPVALHRPPGGVHDDVLAQEGALDVLQDRRLERLHPGSDPGALGRTTPAVDAADVVGDPPAARGMPDTWRLPPQVHRRKPVRR